MLAGIPLDLAPIVEFVLPSVLLGSLEPLSVFVISFPSLEESFTTDRALLSCTILTRVDSLAVPIQLYVVSVFNQADVQSNTQSFLEVLGCDLCLSRPVKVVEMYEWYTRISW